MFLNASTWTSHKWKKSPLPRWQSCIRAALGKPSTQHIVWTLTDSFQGTHMHQPYRNRYPMGGRKIMFPWKPNWDFYSLIYCSNYIETSNIQSFNIHVTLAMKRIVIRDNVLLYTFANSCFETIWPTKTINTFNNCALLPQYLAISPNKQVLLKCWYAATVMGVSSLSQKKW